MWRGQLVRCWLLLATLCHATPVLSQTINLGLAAPLSGPLASLGDQVRRGTEVAIDEINEKGGVLGRKLALKTADDGCEPARAVEAARRLTQLDKVVAVIGHVCAPASFAAAPVYAAARVAMVTPAPVDQRLIEAATKNGWRNIFMMAGSIQSQGFAAGTYLARRYTGGDIALVYDQSSYGADLAGGFKQALKDRSASLTFETSLTGNVVDVRPTVDQLRAAKPTAVYLATTPANAASLVKRAKEIGLDTTFVSGNAIRRPEFLEIAGRATEGVLSTTLPDAQSLPAAAEAIALLRQRGSGTEGYTLYAYAAVQVLSQAIDKAGSTELDRFEPVLRQQSFPTALGTVRFDKAGDRDVSQVAFSQWRDGGIAPFDPSQFWDVSRDAMTTVLATASGSTSRARARPVLIDDGGSSSAIVAKALQGVFWNTYFTREGEPDAKLSTRSQASYTLVLDLSAYNYRQIGETNAAGTAVDPRVKNALEKAPQEPIELKIRPVVVTPLLTLEDDPVKALRVDRKKLVRPQEGTAVVEENRLVGRFKVGAINLPEFAAEVRAGQVTFTVKVAENVAPGCAVIAFTIWDFRDNPIDHLLQTVPVGDGTTQPDCTRTNPEALKGGFATLMNPVFSIGAADSQQPIQAALHLFQIIAQGQQKTVAFFIDKGQYRPPEPGKPAIEQGVFSWQTTSRWLSEYVSKPTGLPAKIAAAWKDADKGSPGPYAGAADELADWIFGADLASRPKAEAARDALKKLAEAQTTPVVVVRAVDENNRKIYVPLNLIAAAGNTGGLAKPITVVQPLQTERYEAPSCIGHWSFGLSNETKALDVNLMGEFDALAAAKPATGETWIRNAADLKTYFKMTPALPASVPATPIPSEGLVLLAHHDGFGVYFDDVNGRVLHQGLRHAYPPGSVAVLAACVTANPSSGMDILNGLNDSGVDAMIVSPFNVRIDYGARMAFEFAKVVRQHRENRRTPTLAEMFAQATGETKEFFKKKKPNARLEEMALEFILLGNPYLRLCAP
ncbi:branched-chain amino acid ABC transporter substrate-binding protein [Bradyrhizobium sp. Mp27]|nr:branched-chain amino acid ABC transporter substrate-binding protein [Bradyrhizobium sp. Mp27]MDI2077406.1 branched-chain amino acid ABC transporter substrate-binding protein [Bradyrhizobium sp. Mp27]